MGAWDGDTRGAAQPTPARGSPELLPPPMPCRGEDAGVLAHCCCWRRAAPQQMGRGLAILQPFQPPSEREVQVPAAGGHSCVTCRPRQGPVPSARSGAGPGPCPVPGVGGSVGWTAASLRAPAEAASPPPGHESTLAARPEIWEAEGRLEPDPSAPGAQIPAPPGLAVWPWAVSTPMKRDRVARMTCGAPRSKHPEASAVLLSCQVQAPRRALTWWLRASHPLRWAAGLARS